jgi:peptide/nickel transport system substrate-binding protein
MNRLAKKIVALLLICITLVPFAACDSNQPGDTQPSNTPSGDAQPGDSQPDGEQPGDSQPAAEPDRVLNVAVAQDSGTLHPFKATAFGFSGVARCYQDVLFDYKTDGSIEYLLSTGWDDVSETEHTLHLREGVTFSNGNPLTAEDVIFSLELAAEDPQWFMNVNNVNFEKTNIIDDYTIDLWFTVYDVGNFPGLMLMYILDKESYDEQALATQSIGTGPYVVTDYVANSYVTVEARDGFWGESPAIKTIKFHVMNESSQRTNALAIGELDYTGILAEDNDYVISLGGYDVKAWLSGSCALAYFNVTPGTPFGTLEARKAVMHAIDRESINDICYNGLSIIPRWGMTEANMDFEERFIDPEDDVYSIGYDLELAKTEAEQSGIVGEKIRIMTNGTEQFISMAEIVQQNLKAIGVDSEILNYDQATYWTMLMDQSNFEIALYMNGSPKNLSIDMFPGYVEFFNLGWSGPERDEFLALGKKGLGTADAEQRGDILYEISREWENIHLWFALAENINPRAFSTDLGGIELYNDGEVRYYNWYWVA